MSRFWRYLGSTIANPYRTYNRLLDDPQKLKHGTGAVLLIGVLYTLTVIGLAIVRADISTPPWVAIPAEHYYFWEMFFALPVFTLGWILAAGLVQLVSKAFRGSGSYEGTLAVLGFAMALPSFVTWIPETIGTVLFVSGVMTQKQWLEITSRPGFWQVFAGVYQFVALAWYLVLIPVAVAAAQKLRWWQSTLVGVFTLAVTGLLMFVFIR